MLEQNVFNNKP